MKNKFNQCCIFWKSIPRLIQYLLVIAIILMIAVISVFVFNFHHLSIAKTTEEWAQFGDYIGGTLNPIFALFSFLALLYTIKQQVDQLKHSQAELKLTRKELARSATAQDASKSIMESQLKTQSAQQFDSIFFAMLRELNVLSEILNLTPPKDPSNQNHKYFPPKSPFSITYDYIFSTNPSSVSTMYNDLLENKKIAQYFMLLYQLLKIIDTKIIGDEAKITKKMYSNIVRASISEQALQLLIVNVSYPEFKQYRNLVEKFSFFEHVSFEPSNNGYNLPLINLVAKLNKIAFGDSIYFKTLQNKTLFSVFVPKHQILNVLDLYRQTFLTLNNNQIIEKDMIDGQTFYQVSKDIDGKEHKIFLGHHDYQPTYYQTTDDQHPWKCHSYIDDDNNIRIYDGSARSTKAKFLYTIGFEKDGQVTIQYEA